MAVGAASVYAGSAAALPTAPTPPSPTTGIPVPCQSPKSWPGDDVPISEITEQLEQTWGFKLVGPYWVNKHRRSIQMVWETLGAVSCTTYLDTLKAKVNGRVGLNAAHISGFAWGDWSITRSGYVTFDFSKFGRMIETDPGRLSRLVVHELGHVFNSDRGSNPAYWRRFKKLFTKHGRFSDYGGYSVTETFAEVLGYYVGRCSKKNPYDTGKFDEYYAFVRDEVFDGREFGPEPGIPSDCTAPPQPTATPTPTPIPGWIQAVSRG